MSPKDFLVKFFLAVALILGAVYALTYFEVRRYESAPEQAVTLPDGRKPEVQEDPTGGLPLERPANGAKIKNLYSIDKFPVSYSAGGNLKAIAPDYSSITISGAGDGDMRAIVTETTEVFYNGVPAELSVIKTAEQVTILGRKRSVDGAEFVADTIYANSVTEVPVTP